jgi:ElaB/YqjD/DUF883 family membrane-anchored ribosome-binding protein
MGQEEDHMQRTRTKKAIHNSFDHIRDHASGMAGEVRDLGETLKDVIFEKIADLMKSAVSFGERGQEAARETASEAREAVEQRIQKHPYQSVLIAAGAGLALGLFLRRR